MRQQVKRAAWHLHSSFHDMGMAWRGMDATASRFAAPCVPISIQAMPRHTLLFASSTASCASTTNVLPAKPLHTLMQIAGCPPYQHSLTCISSL